jgi:CheY-like chemotaxis protein
MSSAGRAAALTHRLLAFSRRQTLDPRPLSPNRLVQGLEELVTRTVGPNITVRVVLAGDAGTILCDPSQLENALLNLAINARDAMPEGGRLTMETANAEVSPALAAQLDMQPGPYVTLAVADTGTGMSAEVAARAFDPFFTTKPIGEGTGLGLSMIYGFAKQSGGQVRIETEEGRGTTVRLYLPRHAGQGEEEEPGAAPAATPCAGLGETVLVVDDEPVIRMLVVEVLQDLGYAALEAADGPTALQILKTAERLDLLVTDVGLPGGLNGRQLADAVRADRPGLKVLFITGFAETAALGSGRLEPGMQVMTKPFALDALALRIRSMIEGE